MKKFTSCCLLLIGLSLTSFVGPVESVEQSSFSVAALESSREDPFVLSRWDEHTVPVVGFGQHMPDRQSSLNLVSDIPPMAPLAGIEKIKTMPEEDIPAYLEEHFPNLEERMKRLAVYMGFMPEDARDVEVEFIYGSSSRATALDASYAAYNGYFQNELVALIRFDGNEKPIGMLVKCSNGLIQLVDQSSMKPVYAYIDEEKKPRRDLVQDYTPARFGDVRNLEGLSYNPFEIQARLPVEHRSVAFQLEPMVPVTQDALAYQPTLQTLPLLEIATDRE